MQKSVLTISRTEKKTKIFTAKKAPLQICFRLSAILQNRSDLSGFWFSGWIDRFALFTGLKLFPIFYYNRTKLKADSRLTGRTGRSGPVFKTMVTPLWPLNNFYRSNFKNSIVELQVLILNTQHQISYTIQISLTIWAINSYFVYSVQIQKSWNLNWSLINLNICKHRGDNKKMKSTSGFVKYTSNRKLLNGVNNSKSHTKYNWNQLIYLCVCVYGFLNKRYLFFHFSL